MWDSPSTPSKPTSGGGLESLTFRLVRAILKRVLSLGTIVWECLVQSFPFATPPSEDQDINHVRQKLAGGTLPWDVLETQNTDPIYSVIRDCWNADPALRPSASFVTQTLLDHLVRNLVGAPPVTETPYDILLTVKERVHQRIQSRMRDKEQGNDINPDDVKILRQSADVDVDPVSCFLLGDAIFRHLIPAHMYDEGDIEYSVEAAAGDEGMFWVVSCTSAVFDSLFRLLVRRLRGALKYLELAVDGGIEGALRECGKAHHALAALYVGK